MLTHFNSLLREAKCSRPLHESKVVLCRKNHHPTTSFPYQASGATTSSVECVSDNDKATHVVGVDTLSRTIDPQTGIVSLTALGSIHPPPRKQRKHRCANQFFFILHSFALSVSSPATSRSPPGFPLSSAAMLSPMSTRSPMSIPRPRR